MSAFYQKMAATALRLLTKFGAPIVLARETGRDIDPVTGVDTAGVDASVTTTGLIKPYPDRMIDGTRILEGDKELVLSSEHQPLPSDKPQIGGEDWSIISIKTIDPDLTGAVVYFVQVRK